MSKTIALIGALDTKGADFAFVKAEIERRSHRPLVINTGVVGEPSFTPDIEAAAVAEAAGTTLDALRQAADRGNAIASMANGIAPWSATSMPEGRLTRYWPWVARPGR